MPRQGGAFQLGSMGVKLAAISDGLSNTILAGEKHVPKNAFGVGVLDSSTYNGDYPLCFTRSAGMGVGIAQTPDEVTWKWGSTIHFCANLCSAMAAFMPSRRESVRTPSAACVPGKAESRHRIIEPAATVVSRGRE